MYEDPAYQLNANSMKNSTVENEIQNIIEIDEF